MQYPLIEHNGRRAAITVAMAHGGRWQASVTLEQDGDSARRGSHMGPVSVPNSFPSDTAAAEAAYAFARTLIEREAVST